jgi:murein DD-endopeptidase MepM/ murein hydrolase activator NlpD
VTGAVRVLPGRRAFVAGAIATGVASGLLPATAKADPYSNGGGPSVMVNGRAIPRDVVFRFLPVTLPLSSIRVSSLYGMRANPFDRRRSEFHPGVDFADVIGTPIHATGAGLVSMSETRGAYGLMVEVRHALGFRTRYGHMSRSAVAPGDVVDRDSILGYVGSTGRSTGPHVYYEIIVDGERLDPIGFILKMNDLYHHLG